MVYDKNLAWTGLAGTILNWAKNSKKHSME